MTTLFASGHSTLGIGAALESLRHPGHVAVRAVGEPGGEVLARARRRFGRGDAAGVEAERARLGAQAAQKSRSA